MEDHGAVLTISLKGKCNSTCDNIVLIIMILKINFVTGSSAGVVDHDSYG